MLGRWLVALIIVSFLAASASIIPGSMSAVAYEIKPNQPINESPGNGFDDIDLNHSFRSSSFSSPRDGAMHYASQWQITTRSGDYSNPVFDSGIIKIDLDKEVMNLATLNMDSGYLKVNTEYYWHVRHQDDYGSWSDYSIETSFKTIISGQPSRPVNVFPENKTTNISLIPTLVSSNYVSPDDGASHNASQWQITSIQGDYSRPIFDSGIDTANLNQIAVGDYSESGSADGTDTEDSAEPAKIGTCLHYNTTYYWHVRHQDSYGNWSNWSPETRFKTIAWGLPSTPVNIFPSEGTIDILLTPTLRSSDFASLNGNATHLASRWQIRTFSGSYTSPVFDSGVDTANLTNITIPEEYLNNKTVYYWHVKYQDSYGFWSIHSKETSFVTVDVLPPKQPAVIYPPLAAIDVNLTPILQSSAFSGLDEGTSHSASQWQITTNQGDYTNPVFDSGEDTTNLTKITIDEGYLDYSTTYYWHVRHQDSHGNWSAYSNEASFTTMTMQPPRQPTTIAPSIAAINVSLTPTLRSSLFSSIDLSTIHAASQWQITTNQGDYTDPVFDSGEDTINLTKITIEERYLHYSTVYYWRVRYLDSHRSWSAYSEEAFFTTAIVKPPRQPATVAPSIGAINISLTPTLQSSAFSSLDTGTTHLASQWQITTVQGDYTNAVFDSDLDKENLTRITIVAGYLDINTTYYWRVRYQDNRGIWSDFSSEASFTTESTSEMSFYPNNGKSANNYLLPWVWIALGIVGTIGSLGLVIVSRRK